MLLNLRAVRRSSEPVMLKGAVDFPEIVKENQQVIGMGPINAQLQAEQSGNLSRVHGELWADVEYQCSRCLDTSKTVLQTPFDELFAETANAPSKDEEVHVVTGDEVSLDPFIEQAVNLAIDFRPLCTADCKGLCPVCGTNLNRESCSCEQKPVDVRFAALEDLLKQGDSE